MDPLNVQMIMGSPPMLRAKVSLSNLTLRKKKSPDNNKSPPFRSPPNLPKVDEASNKSPTPAPTVRMRRGFRPLSVFTNSILAPFESETLKAMAELEVAPTKPADKCVQLAVDCSSDKVPPSSQSSLPDSSKALASLSFSNESQISLRAFLAQSSPTSGTFEIIEGPFQALCQIPAPDVSQHPARSANPFESRSTAPGLIATTSPDATNRLSIQPRSSSSKHTSRTSGSSDIFGVEEKKHFKVTGKVETPTTPSRRLSTPSTEPSPLAKYQQKSRPIEVTYHNIDISETDPEQKRTSSGGLRKFSDIFKSRNSGEKQRSPTTSTGEHSPSDTAKQLVGDQSSYQIDYMLTLFQEQYLRTVTCSQTFPYTHHSWYPRHPNTGRFWKSRNLKCTTCVDVYCACCGRTCCAYRAAVLALETHKDNPSGREDAATKIQQITMIFPYGREMPTFLQCTKDTGDTGGCGKLVCPECCGVCPNEACADVQCRKCKKDPWVECNWHSGETQLPDVKNTVGTATSV